MEPRLPRREISGDGEPEMPQPRPYDSSGPKAPMAPAPGNAMVLGSRGALANAPQSAMTIPPPASLSQTPSSELEPTTPNELAMPPRNELAELPTSELAPAPRGELARALNGNGPVAPARAFSERVESFQGRHPELPMSSEDGDRLQPPVLRAGVMPDANEGLLDPGRRALEKLLREKEAWANR